MNELKCSQIKDLLVDYSDGELETKLVARVDAHLEHCDECRARLVRLAASLSLASEVWEDSAQSVGDVQVMPLRRGPAPARRVVLALASTAAALLIGLFVWQQSPEEEAPLAGGAESQGEVPKEALAGTESQDTPIVEIENSEQDLLALIDRVERRARLQVSLELLEQTPSLRSYAEEAERYLAAGYGDLNRVELLQKEASSKRQEDGL